MSAHTPFAAALLDVERPLPPGLRVPCGASAQRRYSIYRNNVVVGLVDALGSLYPVCRTLVSAEFFDAMARLYVERTPPRSPILSLYGAEFPIFAATFPPAADVPYLGDVAWLEQAVTLARNAADATPLPPADFAAIPEARRRDARFAFHPAMALVASPFPIVSIWRMHQDGMTPGPLDLTAPEEALVARPDLAVAVHDLPHGGSAFMSLLMQGASLAQAADAAADDDAFDLAKSLTLLMSAGVVTRIDLPDSACQRDQP